MATFELISMRDAQLELIPFQFGYAVNVISESYIVIPAKAGIHTGWLGRTW